MRKSLIIALSIITSTLWAQYSPDIDWKSITTEHFDILFDARIEDDAQSIANNLESMYDSITINMGGEIDRYTLILPAEMIESNGYVSSLNNKSVFYPVPPVESFTGTLEWYETLGIHETRHMAQQTHIRNSFLQQVLSFLFGSSGYAGAMLIPSYFYEGDAVLTETLLSDSGRGRSPSFERGLRTILLNDKDYTFNEDYAFNKALHGSDKDFYPNFYVLGYYLMTYLRANSDANTVENIVSSAANNPLPLNFSVASYFKAGNTMPDLYYKVMRNLTYLWEEQDQRVTPTTTETLIEYSSKIYTNLKYPKISQNGELFYIETGLDKVSTLCSGEDKYLNISGEYSIHDNNIAYSKTSNDIRWLYSGFSDVYIYDTNSKTERALTEKQRYFNPVYSMDGDKIAVIEFSLDRTPSIVLLDSLNGGFIKSIAFPEDDMITGISWNNDGTDIVFSSIKKEGSYIGTVNVNSEIVEMLTLVDNIEKSRAIYYRDNIIFVSSYSGIDNIHAINIETKEEFQVISTRFGADYPEVVNDELIFSEYTVDGYKIQKYGLDTSNWIKTSFILRDHVDYFEALQSEELPLPDISNTEYPTDNYNPNTHLVDIHSWIVNPIFPMNLTGQMHQDFLIDQENEEAYYFDIMELILISNDSLEYMDSTFFGHYSVLTNRWDIGSSGSYKGFYPQIDWNVSLYSKEDDNSLTSLNTDIGISVPLLSAGSFDFKSFVGGVIPKYYRNLSDSSVDTFDLSYYLQYIYAEVGNPRRVLNYDFKAGTYLSFDQNILGDNALSFQLLAEIITPGFTPSQNLLLQNSLMFDINSSKSITQEEVSYYVMPTISVETDDTSFVSYINVEYGIPLVYLDLSIFTFMYLTTFDLFVGYESFFTSEVEYDQIVKSRISLGYFFLRMPFEFETKFTCFYDIDDSEFGYSFLPVGFKYGI